VAERREANEQRLDALHGTFAGLRLEPVLLSSDEPDQILASFLHWHDRRRERLAQR
jgi:hypothetical protein